MNFISDKPTTPAFGIGKTFVRCINIIFFWRGTQWFVALNMPSDFKPAQVYHPKKASPVVCCFKHAIRSKAYKKRKANRIFSLHKA